MKIGEKIKKMRTAKLMTQSELAGSAITRNMLSQIENGVAQPSLDTVRYLAMRLNVSPGFLLAEGSDEQEYLKYQEIVNIKKAYMSENYRICRDMCLHADMASDDEICLILAECNLEIGIEEFNAGNLHASIEYFDGAMEACAETIYHTETVVARAALYIRYIRLVSAALSSDFADEDQINVFPALIDDRHRYLMWMCEFEKAEMSESSYATEHFFTEMGTPYELHAAARLRIRRRDYAGAYACLRDILMKESAIPEPMLYFVFSDLDVCCRELGDFQRAYEYVNNKMALLQKMLT